MSLCRQGARGAIVVHLDPLPHRAPRPGCIPRRSIPSHPLVQPGQSPGEGHGQTVVERHALLNFSKPHRRQCSSAPRSARLGAALETSRPDHCGGAAPHLGHLSGTTGGIPNGCVSRTISLLSLMRVPLGENAGRVQPPRPGAARGHRAESGRTFRSWSPTRPRGPGGGG